MDKGFGAGTGVGAESARRSAFEAAKVRMNEPLTPEAQTPKLTQFSDPP
jgi:hypothetical protein